MLQKYINEIQQQHRKFPFELIFILFLCVCVGVCLSVLKGMSVGKFLNVKIEFSNVFCFNIMIGDKTKKNLTNSRPLSPFRDGMLNYMAQVTATTTIILFVFPRNLIRQ